MATARFRIGTATTNSAGTTWSWRAYDTPADISSGSYIKIDLESTNGVRTLAVSLPSGDEVTLASGVATVTTVQSSKTSTFQAGTGRARTYIVRAVINNGLDLNNDSVSDYTKQLAVHIKTADNKRLIAVGETDEGDRTYGYTPKLNDLVRGIGSSGVTAGTYTLATITVGTDGRITSAATGAATSGVPVGSVNQIIQYDAIGDAQSTSIVTLASVATPAAVASTGKIYSSGGALLFRGGTGTITVIAPA